MHRKVSTYCYLLIIAVVLLSNQLSSSTQIPDPPPIKALDQEGCLAIGGMVGLESVEFSTLLFIPGIGDGYAERIIEELQKPNLATNGSLRDSLLKIHGIGPKRSESVLGYITPGAGCVIKEQSSHP